METMEHYVFPVINGTAFTRSVDPFGVDTVLINRQLFTDNDIHYIQHKMTLDGEKTATCLDQRLYCMVAWFRRIFYKPWPSSSFHCHHDVEDLSKGEGGVGATAKDWEYGSMS